MHYILQTLQVTGGRVADGVYSTRVSPGGGYVVAGSRGYNYIAVFERETMKKVYGQVLPFRRDVYGKSPHYRFGWRGQRHGEFRESKCCLHDRDFCQRGLDIHH